MMHEIRDEHNTVVARFYPEIDEIDVKNGPMWFRVKLGKLRVAAEKIGVVKSQLGPGFLGRGNLDE
jgi:hypothetical protein